VNSRFRHALLTLLALTGGIGAGSAHAQRPPGADTMSVAAAAESLKVLKQIRTQLDKDRNNAALWYRRGMIAWMLYDRDRTSGGQRQLDWTMLGREADSSIRLAAAIEPRNARYKITQGQYYLGTGWIPVRVQAYRVFDQALTAARRSGDSLLLSEALVEKGRVHWRRYDPSNFGSMPADVRMRALQLQQDSAMTAALGVDVDSITSETPLTRKSLDLARNQDTEAFRHGDGGFRGEIDYKKAEAYFREAHAAAPSFTYAYRQLAMLFADRHRWTELATLARTRTAQDPTDAWAWMTVGLATYRAGNLASGKAAFARGFALLPPAERARLDNIERMVRPSDSVEVASWTPAARQSYAEDYWRWSTPLWSRGTADTRTEFLARVTYAELRWTVGEMRGRRGADSDRGRVHIRYGPPDGRAGGRFGEGWYYDFRRLAFFFRGMPTFATAYFSDPAYAMQVMDSIPARWDNIVNERIDSLPVRVARFRGTADSADVVFASTPPVRAIRAASSLEGPVQTDFWLFDSGLRELAHVSAPTSTPGSRFFVRRLPPGYYQFRMEASAEGSLRAARAVSSFGEAGPVSSAFRMVGFGLSDIFVASRVEPRGQVRRWSDFDVEASAGALARGGEVALLWENYELGERDGAASYEITFTIERKHARLVDRIGTRVVRSLSSLVGREQTDDRVVYRYERTTPHAAAIPDYLSVALDDLPAGEYDFTLSVLDRVTGRTTATTARMAIRD
jgi:GWxTD domain-containing protein